MAELLSPGNIAGLPITKVQERSPFLNILLYGESGTGKTILMGSADAVPEMRPVLIVDIEGGTESLRSYYPDVDTVRVTTWREMQAVYEELRRGNTKYQTVGLDSLTEIQKFNMYQIMKDLIDKKGDASNVDMDVPSMREWGKNLEQIRKFVRAFRDLPMHTVFTALVRQDKNSMTGAVNNKPSLSGKMADEVAAFLDIVAYYYVKEIPVEGKSESEVHRMLLTRRTPTFVAKDRSDKLPQVVADPTMLDLYRIMYKSPKSVTMAK